MCLFVILAFAIKSVVLEMSAPATMTVSSRDQEVGMNMTSFSIAVRTEDDIVYYSDFINSQWGIYKVSLEGFYAGEKGECILYNTEADNLAYANGQLFYRNTPGSRTYLCRMDLNTGKTETIKKNPTSHYYASDTCLLFSMDSAISTSFSLLSLDGKYETSLYDGAFSEPTVYKGTIYFINELGHLCALRSGTNGEVISSIVHNKFIICDDVIYFVGVNGAGIYSLPLDDQNEQKKITDDTSYGFVVYEDNLYYLNSNDNDSLYKININTGEKELFDRRSFTAINLIGKCLYLCEGESGHVRIVLD
ncbi:MAG: DUF5050 domain-containing protein [Erysipelotrichaceae bacterium]|nr:DUF5050 domain-containing protein [Erysipelotrichaceae bacterium]